MTPKQLQKATSKELLETLKNKARCFYCEGNADRIMTELRNRHGSQIMFAVGLGMWHMQHGEGDAEFNEACDALLERLK